MINLNNISFSYTEKPFINNLNLELKEQGIIGIIGPNGSGKSTLVKIMVGLLQGKGDIQIKNKQLSKLNRRELARLIAYVPQIVDIEFDFSVYDVVKMGRYSYAPFFSAKDTTAIEEIHQALKSMELLELQHKQFKSLSGGEKQRTIIASALAQKSDILFLDEPTSALDLKHQQAIYRLLKEVVIKEKKLAVAVTHDVNLAAQFCDRLLMMNNGQIIRDGTPAEVLKFPVIEQIYGVKVYIDINPFTDSLYILPYDLKN